MSNFLKKPDKLKFAIFSQMFKVNINIAVIFVACALDMT